MATNERFVTVLGLALLMTVVTAQAGEAIDARAAIERVYWQERDWPADNASPKPRFEQVLSTEQLQADWQQTLKQRELLRERFGIEITGEALQRELHRMAQTTRDAERLERLFAALDHDAAAAAEYLAQPLLVERLLASAYANDERIHAATLATIPDVLEGELTLAEFHALATDAVTLEWARPGAGASEVTVLRPDHWEQQRQGLRDGLGVEALAAGQVSPLIETDNDFHRFAIEAADDDRLRVSFRSWPKQPLDRWIAGVASDPDADVDPILAPTGGFVLPEIRGERSFDGGARAGSGCTDDTWRGPLQTQPTARVYHTAIWTGTEMIVWGGYRQGFVGLDSGGRYDPATDSWLPTTRIGAPDGRGDHTAVWTGSEMLIWGSGNSSDQGGRYNPTTDSWTPMSEIGQPSPRSSHVAVWTGSEMLVWGGDDFGGGRYNPTTDSWVSISTSGAADSRPLSHAVWTGSEMIVWAGGDDPYDAISDGARYDPTTDSWTSLPFFPQQDRIYDTVVWTGSEMIVWGGLSIFFDEETGDEFEEYLNTGARYNPTTNSWTSIFSPDVAYFPESVWTGTEMFIYGGDVTSSLAQTYNPVTDQFLGPSLGTNLIGDRTGHTIVWTGSEAIVWGGANPFSFQFQDSGDRYDPALDSWTPVARSDAANPRTGHTSVWTGSEMIVFGGRAQTFEGAGIYDPATNSWSEPSTTNIPTFRQSHSAVWTGSEMIVWGGLITDPPNDTGARYNPTTDSWVATSLTNAPSPRSGHGAVWTGSEMLVWGGAFTAPVGLDDGARYDPIGDSWSPISTTNAPAKRTGIEAVWTGSELIVWGGTDGASQLGDGARYAPATDSWTAMAAVGAPSARTGAALRWTGSEVLLWGGIGGGIRKDDGAHYDPATDSWSPMGTSGAPSARSGQSAAWTGEEYVVFGGQFGSTYYNDGGRYDPATQSWSPLSAAGAPTTRAGHTAVWSGDEVIVFGGRTSGAVYNGDHAAYCAASSSCTILDWYGDGDGDGVGDVSDLQQACTQPSGYVAAPGDCDDGNGGVFATPGETESMTLSHDVGTGVTTLSWSEPSALGGTPGSALYDLLRSGTSSDFNSGACLQTQGASLSTTDSTTPAAGAVQFYLSRAGNACPAGTGSLGFQSDATERAGASCP